jgi:hypothetical protein
MNRDSLIARLGNVRLPPDSGRIADVSVVPLRVRRGLSLNTGHCGDVFGASAQGQLQTWYRWGGLLGSARAAAQGWSRKRRPEQVAQRGSPPSVSSSKKADCRFLREAINPQRPLT